MEVGIDHIFDYHDIEDTLDAMTVPRLEEELATGAIADGVLLTPTLLEVEKMPGVRRKQSTNKSRLPATTTKCKMPTINDIDEWFNLCNVVKTVQKTSEKLAH